MCAIEYPRLQYPTLVLLQRLSLGDLALVAGVNC